MAVTNRPITAAILRCRTPLFEWEGCWWGACTKCGRLAWDHEQANVGADINRLARWMGNGCKGIPDPPAMWRDQG